MPPLDNQYKEWICDNIEWLIDLLGYEKFYRRPFFDSSPSNLQQFHKDDSFSVNDFSTHLAQLLEIKESIELEVDSEDSIDKKINCIYIQSPIDGSRTDLIKNLTEELLIYKASELDIEWQNSEDDAIIIAILSAFYGLTSLLTVENHLTIKDHLIAPEITNYLLAALFSIKDPSLISFTDLFNSKARDQIIKIQHSDDTIHKFQQLVPQFKKSDKLLQDLTQAEQMYKNGYYSLAISIIQDLCTKYPQRASFWNILGYYQQRNKQFEESIVSLDKALLIDEHHMYALSNKGLSLLFLQQLEESNAFFIKAENANQENPLYLRNKGIYYAAINNIESAKEYFNHAIVTDPNLELVHYYYAIVLLQNNEKKRAIEQLNISVQKGEHEAIKKLETIK